MAWGLDRFETVNLKQRTQWYAYIRLLFLLAIAVPGLLSLYIIEGWSSSVRIDTAIVVLAVASNLVFYGLTTVGSGQRYLRILGAGWITVDILLICLFIFLNGGIESRSPILYTVPMLITAALFGRRGLYVAAAGSAASYTAMILGDYLGIIHSTGAFDPSLRNDLPYVLNTISFVPAIILVVALSIDFITSLLADKQRQVAETVDALESAQEIAKIGSWEWDLKRDEITWSKELYRIYNLPPRTEPLRFAHYLKLLKPEKAEIHKTIVFDAMKRKTPFTVDHEITLPDGSIRYLHGEGRPVKNKDGKVIKMTGTTQDVTAIYNLDIAKREFVSLASHQLRTPASGVKAFLSLLLDGYGGGLDKKQRSFIHQAFEANNRQLEIIDNLLNLAAIESGKLSLHKEMSVLQDLIKRNLPTYKAHARSRQQSIVFRKPRANVSAMVDPSALLMALDNLVSNASKYTSDHGRIVIELRAGKSAAYIDVSDNGIGIAKKDLPQLFQKFSRLTDPASKTVGGSGVGLYMARHIVELHGGRVSVRSKHGKGTTFTIKLPLSTRTR